MIIATLLQNRFPVSTQEISALVYCSIAYVIIPILTVLLLIKNKGRIPLLLTAISACLLAISFIVGIAETIKYLGILEFIHNGTTQLGYSSYLTREHLYKAVLSFSKNPLNLPCLATNIIVPIIIIAYARRFPGSSSGETDN